MDTKERTDFVSFLRNQQREKFANFALHNSTYAKPCNDMRAFERGLDERNYSPYIIEEVAKTLCVGLSKYE